MAEDQFGDTCRLHVPEEDEVCMVEVQLGGAGEFEE
jgi:hypothetical protein